MLNLTGGEILMILFVALIVLGPERLPELARNMGAAYSKFKKMASTMQAEVQDVLDDPAMKPIREVSEFVAQPRKKLSDLAREADLAANRPAEKPQSAVIDPNGIPPSDAATHADDNSDADTEAETKAADIAADEPDTAPDEDAPDA